MSTETASENKILRACNIAHLKAAIKKDFVTKELLEETLGEINTILQSI